MVPFQSCEFPDDNHGPTGSKNGVPHGAPSPYWWLPYETHGSVWYHSWLHRGTTLQASAQGPLLGRQLGQVYALGVDAPREATVVAVAVVKVG